MVIEDISNALDLWKKQFVKYCFCDSFPSFHVGGEITVEKYIRNQINDNNAIVAIRDNEIVGYMAWMTFDFHNERTAFLPIVGHASTLSDEINTYSAMYHHASQNWVKDNRYNHLWMTYYNDEKIKNELYELGFGSYVVDACQSTSKNIENLSCDYKIELANMQDVDDLIEIANISNQYYIESPIFLKRSIFRKQDIEKILKDNFVLVAREGDRIIGVMSFSVNEDFDFEQLTTTDSAYIGKLGAFVDPNYRGKGIGTALLKNTFRICQEKGKPHIHVCFESSNPHASTFWPKYFKPAIRSVRRTINKDANDVD